MTERSSLAPSRASAPPRIPRAMPGVTIGSSRVVTADIPENCMAAGVPAVAKKRIEQ